jgi:plastocyanin
MPLLAALAVMSVLVATSGCGSGGGGNDDGGANDDGGGGTPICGCTAATADDLTAQAAVPVSFGGTAGLAYSPKCILVAAGTGVTFEGAFSTHPMSATVGTGNPIAHTASGTTATFTFSQPGAFGYQCDVHVASGMCGAVYVQ